MIVCGAAGVAIQKVGEVHDRAVPPSVPVVWPATWRHVLPFQMVEPKSPPTAIQK
jgi:hypothetical protein